MTIYVHYKPVYISLHVCIDLSMNKDYRSQKSPCASLTIHMEHAQNL